MDHQSQTLEISSEHTIQGTHRGSVRVSPNGVLKLDGSLHGTLQIQAGASVIISGEQHGTVVIAAGASVSVLGAIHGTTTVEQGAVIIIEPSGKLAGTLSNNGLVVIRGVFGGARSGSGDIRLEGSGYIKQPKSVEGNVHYYEW